MEYKVACPQCRSALKSAKPIPAGTPIKCPRCGTPFTAPAPQPAAMAVPVGVTAVPFGAAAGAGARPPSSPAFTATPPPAGVNGNGHLAPPAPAKKPLSRGAVLGIVAGGVAALLVLAVVLILVCFSGDKKESAASGESGDAQAAASAAQQQKKNPPPPPPLITLPPAEQIKVDMAVQKGMEFLKKQQRPDGRWIGPQQIGYTALSGLTLLEGGLPPSDPAIQKAVKLLRQNEGRITLTYELALTILFLNRLGERTDRELIQKLALRLVAGQSPQGGWTYQCPNLSKEESDQVLSVLKELKHRTPQDLLADPSSAASQLKRRRNLAVLNTQDQPPGAFFGGGDNSNTQFGILGLLAARMHEIPLDNALALINKRFRSSQNGDGRWFYNGRGEVSRPTPKGQLPTMTCAGLLGVAVGFTLQKDAGPKGIVPEEDPVVKQGLDYLAKFIGEPGKVQPGAKPPMEELYFLWSVERVAVLYQLKTIHGKKWYEWGVEVLLANQNADGSWRGGGHGSSNIVDTCFAILFLQRANLAKDLTDKLNELRGVSPALTNRPPGRKD